MLRIKWTEYVRNDEVLEKMRSKNETFMKNKQKANEVPRTHNEEGGL